MKLLHSGEHFGENKNTLNLNGCILTEAGYTPQMQVPWHYHENAYFYYHIKGHMLEVTRKQSFDCIPGTILFHHWQEPHYNTNFSKDAGFFHVELAQTWFEKHELSASNFQGSNRLEQPLFKSLFHKIYKESKINDSTTSIATEGLLLQVLAEIMRYDAYPKTSVPTWVHKVKEIIHEYYAERITLSFLARETGIHPVHLSRDFPRYFRMTMGDYIRKIKIDKATVFLSDRKKSITEIAYDCGFSDQSHFIRCFKQATGITPNKYRKEIL
jgi:AraC-like DNA-binding protein